MGGDFWTDTNRGTYDDATRALLLGVYKTSDTDDGKSEFRAYHPSDDDQAGFSLSLQSGGGAPKSPMNIFGPQMTQGSVKRWAGSFGVVRAAALAYNNQYLDMTTEEGDTAYLRGPFSYGAQKLIDFWDVNGVAPLAKADMLSDAPGDYTVAGGSFLANLSQLMTGLGNWTSVPEIMALATMLNQTTPFGTLKTDIESDLALISIVAGTITPSTVAASATITAPEIATTIAITPGAVEVTLAGVPTITPAETITAITAPDPVTEAITLTPSTAVDTPDVAAGAVEGKGLVWSNPFVGTLAAGDIAEPTRVEVADEIDAAVAAFTVLANARYEDDLATLRASLFGSRAMMTDQYDVALAVLTARKNAQIDDYDKALRVRQAEMQAECDREYERALFERSSRMVANTLEADRANAENTLRLGDLSFRAITADMDNEFRIDQSTAELAFRSAQATAELALQADKANADLGLSIAEITLRAEQANMETALRAKEVGLRAEEVLVNREVEVGKVNTDATLRVESLNLQAQTSDGELALRADERVVALTLDRDRANVEMRLRADEQTGVLALDKDKVNAELTTRAAEATERLAVQAGEANQSHIAALRNIRVATLGQLYGAVEAWLSSRTNQYAAFSGIVERQVDMDWRESTIQRQNYLDQERLRNETAQQAGNAISAIVDMKWKAQIQNMMVIKEGISAFSGQGGIENIPSQFNQIAQSVGLVSTTASFLGNLVMAMD